MKHLASVIPSLLLVALLSTGPVSPADAHSDAALKEGTLEVVLSEWSLGFKTLEVEAGVLSVHVVNDGKIWHDFAVAETGTTYKIYKTPVLVPGKAVVFFLELPEGRYDLYCSIPGHRERGMLASLAVGETMPPKRPEPGGGGYY
jgi:uncharacterized cupredoxin-like copper-binding protein